MDLEKSIEDSICKCKSSNIASKSNCENCKHLQCKIYYLGKTIAKFTSGKANIDALLCHEYEQVNNLQRSCPENGEPLGTYLLIT